MANNNMPNVMLVDTAFAALPIYNYLIGMGFDVWVMGNRRDDVLAQKAGEKWIDQDYSKISEVESQVNRLSIDCVVPGCTDVSIDTCIMLNGTSTPFDAPQTNRILSNKSLFRDLCEKLNLPSPHIAKLSELPKSGRYICKPVDSFSGRGITIFDGSRFEEAEAANKTAVRESSSGCAIIESYVEGQLYSFSAFVESHSVIASFLVKEGSSANPFAVDTSHLVDDLPGQSMEVLQTSIESISSYLQLKDGLIHTQFIFDGNTPVLVEMTRRCPGDLYSLLIEYSTGFEYAAKYASYFVNELHSTKKKTQCHVLRHTVTSNDDVVFGKFEFLDQQPLRAYYPLESVGRPLLAKQKSRVGILFSEYESHPELSDNYSKFIERSAYVIQ